MKKSTKKSLFTALKEKQLSRRHVFTLIAIFFCSTIFATTYTTQSDGSWTDDNNWIGSSPGTTVGGSHIIIVLHNMTLIGNLTLNGTSELEITNGSITSSGGNFTFAGSQSNVTNGYIKTPDGDVTFNGGTLSFSGGCIEADQDIYFINTTVSFDNYALRTIDNDINFTNTASTFNGFILRAYDDFYYNSGSRSGSIYSISSDNGSIFIAGGVTGTPSLTYVCYYNSFSGTSSSKYSGSKTNDCTLANAIGCSNAPTSEDCDNDGISNTFDLDDDNDGILDVAEGGDFADFDEDGIANKCDLDSDNDGILDVIEAGHATHTTFGRIGSTDTDGDGLVDEVDPDEIGFIVLTPINTDGDTQQDFIDLDSDNDGIPDNLEAQTTATYITPSSTDVDGDGLDDAYDETNNEDGLGLAGKYIILSDIDGIGNPDYLDTDSDQDGLSDNLEAYDIDGNGSVEPDLVLSGTDANSNGLDDKIDLLLDILLALDTDAGIEALILANPSFTPVTPTGLPGYAGAGTEPSFRVENIVVAVSCYLEGPYTGGTPKMTTHLSTGGATSILATQALSQPFNGAPWFYAGTESVTADFFVGKEIVDWILVEARDASDFNTIVGQRACFLLEDGTTIDIDGTTLGASILIPAANYHIVIRHRNHADIASLVAVGIVNGKMNFDIRTSEANVFGGYLKQIGSDYVLHGGDADGNNDINASDKLIHNTQNGNFGNYYSADFNLDTDVNAIDVNTIFAINNGLILLLPF